MLLFSLFACHQTFSHDLVVNDSAPLSDLDLTCTPDESVEERDGTTVWSRVASDGTACAAEVVTMTSLVSWDEVQAKLDEYSVSLDSWTEVGAAFRHLSVSTDQGSVVPGGSELAFAQYVVTEPIPGQDPFAEADALDSRLLAFTYATVGGEDDLAPLLDPERASGALAAIQRSWDAQTAPLLIARASLSVPNEALAELPLTGITVDFDEQVSLDGEVCVLNCM